MAESPSRVFDIEAGILHDNKDEGIYSYTSVFFKNTSISFLYTFPVLCLAHIFLNLIQITHETITWRLSFPYTVICFIMLFS